MRNARAIALATLLAAAASAWLATATGCARGGEDGALSVTGSVTDERITISVPRLAAEPTSTADPGWARVVSVRVAPGDAVAAGDVLAVLDAAPARAAVAEAKASLAEAKARRSLLGEKREDVRDAKAEIADTKVELRDTLAELRDQREELEDQLAQARELAAGPTAPPGAAPPGSPGVPPGTAPPDPREIVAQLEAALAELNAGIARAEDGLAELNDASAELADADAALDDAADAAAAGVDGAEAGVALARLRLARAEVRAPGAAIVIGAPALGDVLAAGSPLVTLRPDAPAEIVTYLTAQQARRIRAGDRADVRADSLDGGPLTTRVTRVGDEYVYVPTKFATREIHLLRGFEVRLRLDAREKSLPPGTPVDLTIREK